MPFKDKETKAAYNRAYFLANREKLIRKMSEYNKLPHAVEARVIYAKTHPEVIRRVVKAWRKRNPEKRSAWWTFANALRAGKLVKPDACPRCGKKGRVDGHHKDYAKPLEVDWLCRACHVAEHAK